MVGARLTAVKLPSPINFSCIVTQLCPHSHCEQEEQLELVGAAGSIKVGGEKGIEKQPY